MGIHWLISLLEGHWLSHFPVLRPGFLVRPIENQMNYLPFPLMVAKLALRLVRFFSLGI